MHPTLLALGLIFLEPKSYQFDSQKREFPMPGRHEDEMFAVVFENKLLPEQMFIDESSFFSGFNSRVLVAYNGGYQTHYRQIHQHDCADPPECGFTETQKSDLKNKRPQPPSEVAVFFISHNLLDINEFS